MKYLAAASVVMGMVLGPAALAQSTAPTDPTAQPSAPQTTRQSSQAPMAAPTQAPQTSQPATIPAPGQPANSESANPKRLAPGSVIPVELTKTVDAKKAKSGDEVVAKVTQDMKSSSGEVVVAKDTKVIGHVTEAQPRSKEQKESQLALAFDRTVNKDGQEVQMPMSIQAVIGQQNNNQNGGGGNDQPPPGNAAPNTTTSPMAGRSPQGPPSGPTPSADTGGGGQTANATRPPINAQTQGVIGISNLSLQPANGNQGSVMTSEKNNVKLESGTMLLLKVNQ